MHSERANETVVEKCCNGKQGKISFISHSQYNEDKQKDNQTDLNAAFLKHQLQVNGIVLTKWSSDYLKQEQQQQNPSTYYLGTQANLNLKQQQKNLDLNNNLKDQPFSINDLKGSTILPIANSIKSMINYHTMNANNESTTDSKVNLPNYHVNDGYINSDDAHSLEYNHEFNNEFNNSYQPPIDESSNHHDDSTKNAIKELLLPVMLSGFGNMGNF